ncbi:TIGR03621 family F420-dependent LLM class oxidoreductase [Streptomyces sp. NPDC091385]|uniref:TIGR03621 family F420-dependent LLM class oxidoreductase n=1 Tax=unclassified Streptomyces TaxID=2593676 RepID=UPI0018F28F80|nr:TIGR03621 family F420-dependent LLM class oxidoreductase [Streptomyces sp. DSM 110735]MBJ7904132.1 TIGR03621 family F420-dependent LLM class oxidoreductase [Streptomyces sp. DSM 110735]
MTSPYTRPLRFGLVVFTPASRAEWVARARRAESLGYDVVSVSDHLGMPAPLATLALVAEATERIRIGTLVLNTSFYRPTVLARDLATVDHYAGGRLEIGLGAGYDKAQFDRAGLPWTGARERVDHLEATVRELRKVFASPETVPPPAQPGGPPILIAGRGPRVLRLAAEHADIVGFTGTAPVRDGDGLVLGGPDEITRRIADVHALLGARARDVELNIPVHRVLPSAATGAVTDVWQNELGLDAAQLAELPSFLIGSPKECADQLLERREKYGLSYYSVLEPEMEAFAKVIEELR